MLYWVYDYLVMEMPLVTVAYHEGSGDLLVGQPHDWTVVPRWLVAVLWGLL